MKADISTLLKPDILTLQRQRMRRGLTRPVARLYDWGAEVSKHLTSTWDAEELRATGDGLDYGESDRFGSRPENFFRPDDNAQLLLSLSLSL